jgi:hypothetical protein
MELSSGLEPSEREVWDPSDWDAYIDLVVRLDEKSLRSAVEFEKDVGDLRVTVETSSGPINCKLLTQQSEGETVEESIKRTEGKRGFQVVFDQDPGKDIVKATDRLWQEFHKVVKKHQAIQGQHKK